VPEAADGYQSRHGQIVTFYSYKGGTGRSMALANVAWILAANGRRVLIADWDLESPGLHRFFRPFLDPRVGGRPGIIDFIRTYEWAAVKFTKQLPAAGGEESKAAAERELEALIENHIRVQDYAVPLNWEFPGDGRLDFLSAGKKKM